MLAKLECILYGSGRLNVQLPLVTMGDGDAQGGLLPMFARQDLGECTYFASGPGWLADLDLNAGIGYIHASPHGDPLPEAIAAVLKPETQPFVTVEWAGTDAKEWDVYRLAYEAPDLRLV